MVGGNSSLPRRNDKAHPVSLNSDFCTFSVNIPSHWMIEHCSAFFLKGWHYIEVILEIRDPHTSICVQCTLCCTQALGKYNDIFFQFLQVFNEVTETSWGIISIWKQNSKKIPCCVGKVRFPERCTVIYGTEKKNQLNYYYHIWAW